MMKMLALFEAPKSGGTLEGWDAELVRFLGTSILAFTVVVLGIAAYLLRAKVHDGFVVLRLFGLVLIVSMSAFLMIVGYGSDQLTPVIGLFGAIVGYLLGKEGSTVPWSPKKGELELK